MDGCRMVRVNPLLSHLVVTIIVGVIGGNEGCQAVYINGLITYHYHFFT